MPYGVTELIKIGSGDTLLLDGTKTSIAVN